MKKPINENKFRTIGYAALAVLVLTVLVVTLQGENLQGYLKLKDLTSKTTTGALQTHPSFSPEPGPLSKEPKPLDTITKAELAKLVVATLKVDTTSYKGCAPDVAGTWYENFACYMVSRNLMGLVNDGKFHGEQLLNRAEGAKVFEQSFFKPADLYAGTQMLFKDVKSADWFYAYVMTLAQKHVLDGDPAIAGIARLQLSHTNLNTQASFLPQNGFSKKSAIVWAKNVPNTNLLLK